MFFGVCGCFTWKHSTYISHFHSICNILELLFYFPIFADVFLVSATCSIGWVLAVGGRHLVTYQHLNMLSCFDVVMDCWWVLAPRLKLINGDWKRGWEEAAATPPAVRILLLFSSFLALVWFAGCWWYCYGMFVDMGCWWEHKKPRKSRPHKPKANTRNPRNHKQKNLYQKPLHTILT